MPWFWLIIVVWLCDEPLGTRCSNEIKERKTYENLADLYTIITATEHLERAYAQDAITQSEYTSECNKLISQFKIAEKAALGSDGMTTEDFMKIYQMDCPRAKDRLLRMGVPEPLKTSDGSGNVAVTVAETGKNHRC